MLQSIDIIKCYFFDEVKIIISFQHLGMYTCKKEILIHLKERRKIDINTERKAKLEQFFLNTFSNIESLC